MSTTDATTSTTGANTNASTGPSGPKETGTTGRRHPLRRAALTSGPIAAAATTAVAAIALAADVPLAIDDKQIPLLAFVELTLIGAVLGGLLAAAVGRFVARRPRRWFVTAAVGLTVVSCVPSAVFPPDVATKVVLVATHLLAASIIVPVLARQVRPGSDGTPAR